MEIKTAVVKHCINTPAIFAAFGNRITPDKVPDNQTYPFARVLQIASDQQYRIDGKENGRMVMVQIDVFDNDLIGADANAELIRTAFSGYTGMMGSVNAGLVKARLVSGSWNSEVKDFHRIVELEIQTND
jgi:hypothetical protein